MARPGSHATTAGARRAEALGARLPPLMVAAERVAATVAQGVHGRRRVGQGDSFWQFRPFVPGDPTNRIDWRQSAKSSRAFVRQTEWEAAQTVLLWRDGSAGMRWRSKGVGEDKHDRAGLLLLALAYLLLRGGERVALMQPGARPVGDRNGLDRLARALGEDDGAGPGLPAPGGAPRHARMVLFGDFLMPLEAVQESVARLAGVPVRGHLLQVLDPAETELPYTGRVRFQAPGARGPDLRDPYTLVPRVETIREEYGRRLAAHQAGLRAICSAAGFGFAVHRTDHSPESALLGLYTALAPE